MRDGPRRLLQQFARLPVPGRVKTRLLPQLSPAEACAVHEELLLRTATTLCGCGLADVELWLDREGQSAIIDSVIGLGAAGPYCQCDGDLGERMQHALGDGLARADAVVLVGSDCPGLGADYLASAFDALLSSDVVIGPAEDGGFVLIGCRRPVDGALADVPWGSERVLETTLTRLRDARFSIRTLAARYDIDTPADLRRWRQA